MAYIGYRLGNGVFGLVESDIFPRILNQEPLDTEEMRKDTPLSLQDAYSYTGIAVAGSLTSASVWSVVRVSYDSNGSESRIQYRTPVAWDSRSSGWPA